MKNKKFITLTLAAFIAVTGALICETHVNAMAEEDSLVTAKVRFAAAMDKKYAEENSSRTMTISTVDLDRLISKAFFA